MAELLQTSEQGLGQPLRLQAIVVISPQFSNGCQGKLHQVVADDLDQPCENDDAAGRERRLRNGTQNEKVIQHVLDEALAKPRI